MLSNLGLVVVIDIPFTLILSVLVFDIYFVFIVSRKTIMFRAHMSVTRIWQLIEKRMMSCISVRGKLPGLQRAVGKNNI